MQDGLFSFDHHGMAGVVPTLEAGDSGRLAGQEVDDLALSLIPPLGADDDDILAHIRCSVLVL